MVVRAHQRESHGLVKPSLVPCSIENMAPAAKSMKPVATTTTRRAGRRHQRRRARRTSVLDEPFAQPLVFVKQLALALYLHRELFALALEGSQFLSHDTLHLIGPVQAGGSAGFRLRHRY